MNTYPTDYQFLYGAPTCSAQIRTNNEDFQVTELSAFDPDGEGEHFYFNIEKNGENTDWVAQQLASYFAVTSKEIGYAGKKDRHAITQQWFSVCLPGVKNISIEAFNTESIKVLEVKKHSRKLRTGALKGNKFSLVLRNVSDDKYFAQRLALIEQGVPNYFGEQRFGINGANLQRGIALLKDEFKERNRTKKGLYISAVRSWIFNHVLSQRIEQGHWLKIMPGDVVMLDGSKSHFQVDDIVALTERMQRQDLHLTGPLWGRGRSLVGEEAQRWENELLEPYTDIAERLEHRGLSQDRRSLRLLPKQLTSVCIAPGVWEVSFELPPGSFATSVLRELCQYSQGRAI